VAEFSLHPKAIADLEEIWEYTVDTWGEEQAERYVRLINDFSADPRTRCILKR
jgi:toxin ParE1/3/4